MFDLRPARPLRFGIHSRLLLVTLAIGLLFVLYIAFNTARQSGRDLMHAREQIRLVAGLAGARLDEHLGDVTQLLHSLAATLPVESNEVESNDASLRRLVPTFPLNLTSVSLWAPDGANIGSSEELPASGRPSAADRPFFIAAMAGPGLSVEAPLRLQKGGEWIAVFALPIVREEKTVAVVSVSTRLQTLTSLLDPESSLPAGAVISLIDAQGRMVGRSLEPERWIGQPAPMDRTLLLRRFGEGRGSTENTGVDGIARIAGFARARTVPWLVYVGVPMDSAMGPAGTNAKESLALGVAMLMIGLVLAAWVASRIARPLRQLSADARLLGEGRFEHRTEVATGSEIGLLAHTLNRMAAALQERIAAAQRSEERLMLALEGSEQALFDWDIAGGKIFYSARASTLRGGPELPSEMTPAEMRALVHPDDVAAVQLRVKEALTGKAPIYEAQFRVRHKDGRWLWLHSRGRVVERDAAGRALRLVGTDADVTRQKAAEQLLRQRAEFDALTGLPNRGLFNDRLEGAIERARRSRKTMALLFLDIDHFKGVNDSRGHGAGDTLLRIVAERMLATVRGVDTVARLAGDEFTVILEGLIEPADAEVVAMKLVEALRPPMQIGGALVSVSTSVGLAVLEASDDAPRLLQRADEALYEAKRAGRDRYVKSPAAAL
ncbi:MAG: diguanylate cyclase [Burkholderiales bacterium]|nr:diguanylate cyclase [Burkholderiales bacterium]